MHVVWCEKGSNPQESKKNDNALDNAINAYNKAIDINPQYIVAWYNRGNIFRDKGEYDLAIKAYDKATDINPLDVDTLSAKERSSLSRKIMGKPLKLSTRL